MRFCSTVCLGLALFAGCSSHPVPSSVDLTLSTVDTLVPAGTTVLGHPTELTMAGGVLYIVDRAASSIVVLDTTGVVLRRIGREGSGPAEFRSPRSLFVDRDTLRVLDQGNGRIQVLTTNGVFIRSLPAPDALGGAVSFRSDGTGLVARNGFDSTLAQRLDSNASAKARLGQPVTPTPQAVDFRALKSEVMRGSVPVFLRNLTLPVLGGDGSCWLVLHAEGTVERYSPRDSLVWRTTLHEPEFDRIRAEFFSSNQADSSANRFSMLSYAATAHAHGDELWLLVRQPAAAPTLILVLSRYALSICSPMMTRPFFESTFHAYHEAQFRVNFEVQRSPR
jgi:hypothetical protein